MRDGSDRVRVASCAVLLLMAATSRLHAAGGRTAPLAAPAGIIQSASLDAGRPLFVATHSRVATTVRFPGAIGAPEGRGFVENDAKAPGEYLISWTTGEAHFPLPPLELAGPSNLNVPYQGLTYVFYFYPVESQFQAVASLNLTAGSADGGPGGRIRPGSGVETAAPGSPARWLGFIDKLKFLRAAAPGMTLQRIAAGFGLECWEPPASETVAGGGRAPYRMTLLRAARNPQLNGVGFALLVENVSDRELAFDVGSFAARAGGILLPQAAVDAPVRLKSGEVGEAYFVAKCPDGVRVSAENRWSISVALTGLRWNPGAALVGSFVGVPDSREAGSQ